MCFKFKSNFKYKLHPTAWTQRTWAGMREEYLKSGEEKIVLPDVAQGGSVIIWLLF